MAMMRQKNSSDNDKRTTMRFHLLVELVTWTMKEMMSIKFPPLQVMLQLCEAEADRRYSATNTTPTSSGAEKATVDT